MQNWMLKHTPLGRIQAAIRAYIERPRPAEPGPILIVHRRIYVPPTGSGVLFVGTLLAMLLTSMNYNLSLGYGFTFLLAGLGFVSLFHGYRNLLGLSISPVKADPVYAGDFAAYSLRIENPRGRRPDLRLYTSDGGVRFDLDAQSSTVQVLTCRAPRRGWQLLGRVVLETHFPLGLVRTLAVVRPDIMCLVYPKPEEDPPPLPIAGGYGRGYRAGADGQDDFAGLRAHRPADSPRHIAWKALARGGAMLTKQFEGAQAGEATVDWAQTEVLGNVEARLSRLTAWVLEAHAQGLSYALHMPSVQVPIGQGPEHFKKCMTLIATFGLKEGR